MKKSLAILFISVIAMSCHFSFDVNHKGDVKNLEQRNISGFSAIEINDAIEIQLTNDSRESVYVGCNNPEKTDRVITEVKNGVLNVYIDHNSFKNNSDLNIVVKISAPKINSIKASNASSVTTTNTLNTDNLLIEASGASSIKASVNTSEIKVDAHGASSISIEGTSKIISINAAGASTINTKKCFAEKCIVDISSASTAKISASTEITGELNGASNLRYIGNAAKVSVNAHGASSLEKSE